MSTSVEDERSEETAGDGEAYERDGIKERSEDGQTVKLPTCRFTYSIIGVTGK